jgi:hypothetical protein
MNNKTIEKKNTPAPPKEKKTIIILSEAVPVNLTTEWKVKIFPNIFKHISNIVESL